MWRFYTDILGLGSLVRASQIPIQPSLFEVSSLTWGFFIPFKASDSLVYLFSAEICLFFGTNFSLLVVNSLEGVLNSLISTSWCCFPFLNGSQFGINWVQKVASTDILWEVKTDWFDLIPGNKPKESVY